MSMAYVDALLAATPLRCCCILINPKAVLTKPDHDAANG